MEKLLFLVHRIPYPPNKGDKIRSFNILRAVYEKYKVYLASFVDDKDDMQHKDKVNEYCEDTYLEFLSSKYATIKSTRGFLRRHPLTLGYYHSQKMQQWVDTTISCENISKVLVFSSSMAQYVDKRKYENMSRIIDFVDIDSDKWRQYAESKSWPMNWVYHRESRHLQEYEKHITDSFDYSTFVSKDEAKHYMRTHQLDSTKVGYINNGVDTEYFSPANMLVSPYEENEQVIVFTGAMDYWANVDAVLWFASEIFPVIRKAHPKVNFYIVGSNPKESVRSLGNEEGIYVTGRVEDIRAYLKYASCAVAPLRIARGIQNKVLEAMSMAKYVVASPEAMEGINVCDNCELSIASKPDEYVQMVIDVLFRKDIIHANTSRDCMLSHYGWKATLKRLVDILGNQ